KIIEMCRLYEIQQFTVTGRMGCRLNHLRKRRFEVIIIYPGNLVEIRLFRIRHKIGVFLNEYRPNRYRFKMLVIFSTINLDVPDARCEWQLPGEIDVPIISLCRCEHGRGRKFDPRWICRDKLDLIKI